MDFLKDLHKHRGMYLMFIPGLIILFINNYLPMPGVLLAFKDYNYADGFLGSAWCGFENFRYLFESGKALNIIKNILYYNVLFMVLSIVLPVTLAIMLNELWQKKMAKFYQNVLFLPYFLSWVVVSYLVFIFLSMDMGVLNRLFGTNINWYIEPKYWYIILPVVNMWKWVGYDTVLFLAAICGFDPALYEAATVDGATRWQQIKSITIPLLLPTMIILTLLKVGRIFYCDFGLFYIVPRNSGAINSATEVMDTYVYRGLRETADIGMASAAGLFQAVIGFILIVIVNKFVRKINPDNALY